MGQRLRCSISISCNVHEFQKFTDPPISGNQLIGANQTKYVSSKLKQLKGWDKDYVVLFYVLATFMKVEKLAYPPISGNWQINQIIDWVSEF